MAAGKKRTNRILLIVILIIAVGAVLLFLLLTSKQPGKTPEQTGATQAPNYDVVDIVVASQYIPRGSLITSDLLTTIKYPSADLPQGTFFSTIDEAVGTKAKYNIEPAVPLTINMVIHEDGGSLASFDIPAGMTAYSIKASPETMVAYAPQKGDHIMIVACMLLADVDTEFQSRLPNNTTSTTSTAGLPVGETIAANGSGTSTLGSFSLNLYGRYELDTATNELVYLMPYETQRPRLVCQTVIQDAEVLQLGMFPLGASDVSATPTPVVVTSGETTITGTGLPGSVTIIVSPQDTLVLNYLQLSGATLSMALRSAGDTAPITTDPVTLQYIMDQKNIPSPLKLPYSVEPRVDSLAYPGFNDYILMQP